MIEEERQPDPTGKYGMLWSYGISEASIELACFRSIGMVPDFDTGHTRLFHFERAMDLILPEHLPDGRVGFIKSKWSERRIQSFIDPKRKFQTWWGSSSAGKSTDAAAIMFVYFLAAPDKTAIQICSTSKPALMKRIWSEIVRFYQLFPDDQLPMEYFRGKPAFQYKIPGTNNFSEKAGIFGRALLRGTVAEAVGEIIGVHNEYNILVIDELQASRWAGVEAFDNLDSGREAKFLGMGNPVSRLDPLGLASKPRKGWLSIGPHLEEWETEKGHTLYFDGLKSPAVDDPVKYYYLIKKDQIETMRKNPGENTPRFWTMIRGFMPPEGLIQTVFSESLIQQHRLQDQVEWVEQPMLVAALDESFTIGGDRCFLQLANIGMTTRGVVCICMREGIVINIEIQEGVPIEYFIVRKVRDYCVSMGIPREHFGIDVTGQQTALASIFDKEWGVGTFRCHFGGAAKGERVSRDDQRPSKEVYWNRVTELWYTFREFAISGQVAGMSDDACREACSRLVIQKGTKIAIESKEEMKSRTSQSPDIMDGHAIIGAMAVERFNMLPGTNNFGTHEAVISDEMMREFDLDAPDKAYTGSDVPEDFLDEKLYL
jgi:hypothetical protein